MSTNFGPKAAVAEFLAAKTALLDFESSNPEFVEAYHRLVEEYNLKLGAMEQAIREETTFGKSNSVLYAEGIRAEKARFYQADPMKFWSHAKGVYQNHPEIIKAVNPAPLLARAPDLFEQVPEAVKEIDAKAAFKLCEAKLVSEEAYDGIWVQEQIKVFRPKPINLKVK